MVAVAATTALLICRHGDIIGHVAIKHTGGACKKSFVRRITTVSHLFVWFRWLNPIAPPPNTASPNDSFSSFLPLLIPLWLACLLAAGCYSRDCCTSWFHKDTAFSKGICPFSVLIVMEQMMRFKDCSVPLTKRIEE
ncbi:hypothetical protein V6N12_025157 [Hibiscus sabdariffa]|uniref:Secreted protein n=1 Tax=Hibiscus sabdariffa TaxID=183260 RepID=A0ABR2BLL8_9ROSI